MHEIVKRRQKAAGRTIDHDRGAITVVDHIRVVDRMAVIMAARILGDGTPIAGVIRGAGTGRVRGTIQIIGAVVETGEAEIVIVGIAIDNEVVIVDHKINVIKRRVFGKQCI